MADSPHISMYKTIRCSLRFVTQPVHAAAAKASGEVCTAHPIVMPLLLGQEALLSDGAASASADVGRCTAELAGIWDEIKKTSTALAIAEAMAKPGLSDRRERATKADGLAQRMPPLRDEVKAVAPLLPAFHEALAALGSVDGQRHVFTLLLQRCQWRRWGRLRMERIQALTVLKGTRSCAKRAKELQIDEAHAKGQERVVRQAVVECEPPSSDARLASDTRFRCAPGL